MRAEALFFILITFVISSCVHQPKLRPIAAPQKPVKKLASDFSYQIKSYSGADDSSGVWELKKIEFKGPLSKDVLAKIHSDLDLIVESWKCFKPIQVDGYERVTTEKPLPEDIRNSTAFGEFSSIEFSKSVIGVTYVVDRRNCVKDIPLWITGARVYSGASGNLLRFERNFTRVEDLHQEIVKKFQLSLAGDPQLKTKCEGKVNLTRDPKMGDRYFSFFVRDNTLIFSDNSTGPCVLLVEFSEQEILPYLMKKSPLRKYFTEI